MRSYRSIAVLLTATTLLTANFAANHLAAAESARLITYQQEGQTFYALSLMPEVERKQAESSAIVVLMDTSASQQGAYRASAMAALETLLQNLRPGDQVELLGVDLDIKPMTDEFVAPGSPRLSAAIDQLREQVPLGSTDLAHALQAATERLAFADAEQRTIVYLGDGISIANLLDTSTLGEVVGKLRDARVSVTSFAVGPKIDAQLLAVLANQTGGNLYVQPAMVWQDEKEGISDQRAQEENLRNAQVAGRRLAEWTRATVLWPKTVNLASELGQTFPAVMPPLRTDRDTILLGSTTDALPAAIDVQMEVEGHFGSVELHWAVQPEASQEDHAFLTQIIENARGDEGMSLPTLGSAGLAETARLVGARADQLTRLAQRAVSAGDHEAAKRIAESVLRIDPGNAQARTVQHVIGNLGPEEFGPPVLQPGESIVVEHSVPLQGDITLIQPGSVVGPVVEEGLLARVASDGAFLDQVEQERRVYAEMLSKDIQNEIVDARTEMSSNPTLAIQNLKLALESVTRAADLEAAKRAELLSKLRTALKEARYQASLKDELDRQREEQLASVRERKLLNERLNRDREREKQLMSRFNSLMDERRYLEAQEVAQIVEEIDPSGVMPRVATLVARQQRHHHLQQVARSARWQGFFDTMYQIELSMIPFSATPPIVYPDAEVWQDLTNRRKKYASVDLSASGKAEERIQTALRGPLKLPLDFIDTPLLDVMTQLSEDYEIPIQFDRSALDEVAISPDTEVTITISNVSLRSALNLMLKEPELQDLTYVIDDEVLLITTKDVADATLKVKVYPVADLVLPIQNLGIIGGGQGGGGRGGGQGGGGGGGFGGGGGGGGGGFGGGGGGGQGGGGGGGFFNVADEVQDGTADTASQTASSTKTLILSSSKTEEMQSSDPQGPAATRQTVRDLMNDSQFEQVIGLIQSALRQGEARPWMYETLGIAMELAGREKSEIERAIMSACDFSSSPDELLLIAQYLSRIDLDARTVSVCRQIVKLSPLHREAYVLGLRSAQRAEDRAGIRWATVGILSHAWSREQQAIRTTATRVAKATLEEMLASGDKKAHAKFHRELNEAVVRDIVIKATWSGDADIDLLVEEPGGTTCSLQKSRTTGGGVSLGDTYASYEKSNKEGFSEEYICAKAFPGTYRVRVRKVWGKVVADKVTVDIYQFYGTKDQLHERQHITVQNDSDAMVVFELEQGRRTKPLEAERLEVAISRQQAISRAVLAQQLDDFSDPRISPDRLSERRLRRQLALGGRGAVGFQPIIQILPDGTQMVATAVISPDRRYVRITASPSFTGIGDVTTFTFAGEADAAAGGAGGGGAGF